MCSLRVPAGLRSTRLIKITISMRCRAGQLTPKGLLKMSMRERAFFLAAALLWAGGGFLHAQGANLGRPLTPEEIKKADITIWPDGKGLPPGSGSVAAGAAVYASRCQACHGPDGAGKPMEPLTGGVGTLAS